MPPAAVLFLAQNSAAEAAPRSGVFTRYVLENPWPLGFVLAIAGAVVLWNGLREGLPMRQRLGFGLAIVGAIVLAAGWLIETAGEQAARVTRELVDAVVANDTQAAIALFSDDAVMSIGSPRNPGFDLDYITERLDRLAARYTIDSNSITGLKLATESRRVGHVQMACMTTVDGLPYPNMSRWMLRVERQEDGSWKVTRLTCVEINNQVPSSAEMW